MMRAHDANIMLHIHPSKYNNCVVNYMHLFDGDEEERGREEVNERKKNE